MQDVQHLLDCHKFLPRVFAIGIPEFGGLDHLPIIVADGTNFSFRQQSFQGFATRLRALGAIADTIGDVLGNGDTVGPIGGNDSRRPPFDPAGDVKAVINAAVVAGNDAPFVIVRHPLQGLRSITNGGDHQPALNLEEFSGRHGSAVLDPGSLQSQALDPIAAQNLYRRGIKAEMDTFGFLFGLSIRELLEGIQVSLLQALVPIRKVVDDGIGEVRDVDLRHALLQLAHFQQLDIGELGFDGATSTENINIFYRRATDR